MKYAKVIAFMAMGSAATLLYQKYNKPIMKKVEQFADETINKANNALDEMM